MFWFTSVTLFTGFGPDRPRDPWSVDLSLELGNIPHLSTEERTVGFDGTKTENLNNSPIFARPILTLGLPWELALSVAWVPPIEVFGVRPNLVGLALERPLLERGPWLVSARLHGQVGKTRGSFTCPGYAARYEPGSDGNPYGCDSESDDRVIQNDLGLEVAGSRRFESLGGLEPYLALGANWLDVEFHTRAETFGAPDRTRLGADTWTFSLGAGLGYPLGDDLWAGLGVFWSPLEIRRDDRKRHESLVNARAEVRYSLW